MRLSHKLATIKLDVELEVEIPELVHGEADDAALYDLFSVMEFKTWIRELEEKGVSGAGGMKPETRQRIWESARQAPR